MIEHAHMHGSREREGRNTYDFPSSHSLISNPPGSLRTWEGGESQGSALPGPEQGREGQGMVVTGVGGGWPMRVTSTFLSTYVTVLENHKDFNSSTSLKYLLLFAGECVSAHAQTHIHTCVCVLMYMCVFTEFPPVSS